MPDFNNERVLDHDLPRFEDVELTPVSPKYLQVVIVNNIILALIVLCVSATGYYFLRSLLSQGAWILPAVLLILMIFNFVYQIFAFYQRKYAFRERDIIYQYGLISKTIIIIPFNRIQHTALEEGWLSRSLGLKSITVFTAGAGGSDLSINGLPKQTAESFNQLILTKIEGEKAETVAPPFTDLAEDSQNTPEATPTKDLNKDNERSL